MSDEKTTGPQWDKAGISYDLYEKMWEVLIPDDLECVSAKEAHAVRNKVKAIPGMMSALKNCVNFIRRMEAGEDISYLEMTAARADCEIVLAQANGVSRKDAEAQRAETVSKE